MLEQRFSLELTKNGVQKSVYARQGENNARTLSIALTIAGKVANISGYNIRAYYDDNTYSTITNNGNPIEMEIPGTLCANAGERVCELKLFKDDDATDTITEVCYSPQFAVIVEGTIGAEAESVPAGQAVQYEPLLGTSTVSQSAISSTDQFVVYGSDGTTNKTLRKSATDVADAISKKHSHANKALLDTYTQTEADIADSVTKKHNHSNKSFLDGLNDTYFDGRYYTESETDTKLSSKQNTLTAGANITIVNDVISATGGEVVIVHLTEDAQGNISCTDATITEIKGYYDAGKLVYCQDVNGIRLPLVMATSTAVSFAFGGADGSHDDVINGLTYIGVVSGESDTWFFTEATLDGKMTEIYNSSTSKSKYTPSELKDMMESHTGMQYNGISILKSEMLNSKFYFYLLDNYNIEKYEVDASKNVSRVTQRILVDDNELSGAITSHNTSANAHSTLFNGKANVNHTHNGNDVSYSTSTVYNDGTVGKAISGKADAIHTHDDRYYTESEVDTKLGAKQDTLVSGTNIKTINNQAITGSGNITIEGGTTEVQVSASQPTDPNVLIWIDSDDTETPSNFLDSTMLKSPYSESNKILTEADAGGDAGDITYNSSATYSNGTVGKELKEQSEKIANKLDLSEHWDSTNNCTDEIDTGDKWIDGKTIYKKILSFSSSSITFSNNYAELSHGISNLDTVVNTNILFKLNTGGWTIPSGRISGETDILSLSGVNSTIVNLFVTNNIQQFTGVYYVIIEFTTT